MSRELPDPLTLKAGDELAGMPVVEVWRVQTTDDERGTAGATKGWYSNKQAALDANHKAGWFGGNGILSCYLALNVSNNYFVFEAPRSYGTGDGILHRTLVEPIDLDGYKTRAYRAERKVALSKLSERERLILKIKTEEHD